MVNVARFESFGVEIELDDSFRFRDHGYVESPVDYFNALYPNGKRVEENGKTLGICGKRTMVESGRRISSLHICYINHENPAYNLHIRGHEETHALFGVGRIDVLQERILRDLGKIIDFPKISDHEVIADIGGMYATSRGGFLPYLTHRMDKQCFREACDIFEKA